MTELGTSVTRPAGCCKTSIAKHWWVRGNDEHDLKLSFAAKCQLAGPTVAQLVFSLALECHTHRSRPLDKSLQGFFQQFGQNWEKIIDLTSKFGEINDIEHNKGSKIYHQNQVILDCINYAKHTT